MRTAPSRASGVKRSIPTKVQLTTSVFYVTAESRPYLTVYLVGILV